LAKLPEPPTPGALRRITPEIKVLPAGTELWRVYFREGRYPGTWNRFRDFGPVPNARFDHHEEPLGARKRRILYAATGEHAVVTCMAEVFQDSRIIDPVRGGPWLVGFALARDLPLLDLTGGWPTRAGASMQINSGPRPRVRRWSRAIYEAYGEIAGLYYGSSMYANQPAVALYERAESSLSPSPVFHAPLSHPALLEMLRNAAVDLGYDLS
jgi:hypothetical protein